MLKGFDFPFYCLSKIDAFLGLYMRKYNGGNVTRKVAYDRTQVKITRKTEEIKNLHLCSVVSILQQSVEIAVYSSRNY